jgi:hypothetical protein
LRSRLIRDLYWLLLLRQVLAAYPQLESIEWAGDDPLLQRAAERIAIARRRTLHARVNQTAGRTAAGFAARLAILVLRRLAYVPYGVVRWFLLRVFTIADPTPDVTTDVVFYTRFPDTWDTSRGGTLRERMYGGLPEFFDEREHTCLYAASTYGSLRRLLRARLRRRSDQETVPIVHLETRLRLSQLLRSYAALSLITRYLRLRRRERGKPVYFSGIDASELLWRELDESVLTPEIPTGQATSAGMADLVSSLPGLRVVFTSFEYQPCERAVAVGTHQASQAAVVGTQAAMYNGNQMGWNLFAPEVERALCPGQHHHMPDLLCAYGALPGRIFSAGLSHGAVAVVGGIRYSFKDPLASDGASENYSILVAVPVVRTEAVALIEAVWRALTDTDAVVSVKFHPLLGLRSDVLRMAEAFPSLGYRITKDDIPELLQKAAMTICGGTSVAMEAIVYGSMPLVFRPPGELAADPMQHVPDAVFFWSTIDELRDAIESCRCRDDAFQRRVGAWPDAIREHLHRVDGSAHERVYSFLVEQGVLAASGKSRVLTQAVKP